MAEPQVIRVPKSYYVQRRVEGHSDWKMAMWRELFQNSVDAGAKRIDISLGDAKPKGSFGRPSELESVVRLSFTDDGSGMDQNTLENVFFAPGETTKKAGYGSTGGFGTARLMLCFSQARYGIRTQNWVVEGNGSEYTLESHLDAIVSRHRLADALEKANATPEVVEQLKAEVARLDAEDADFKGARFEIDIDPNEFGDRWRDASVDNMRRKLDDYLDMSQLPCKVFLNGEEMTSKAKKGPAKRKLVADKEGVGTVEFATVHTSGGKQAKHKGKVIVRVNGAVMFTESGTETQQVIVELDPATAREVLTDNRDGMKFPYRAALTDFVQQLATDTQSALDNKDKRKHIEFKGGRGKMQAEIDTGLLDFGAEGSFADPKGRNADDTHRRPAAVFTTVEEYEQRGFGGVPKPVMDAFVQTVEEGPDQTFLEKYWNSGESEWFKAAIAEGLGVSALTEASEELRDYISETLAIRMKEVGIEPERADDQRFADMHDVHIQIDDIGDNTKLKNAVRRHSPNYWRRKGEHLEGRGLQAHMLLAAWTACAEEAVKALLRVAPDLATDGKIEFATGWYFGASKEKFFRGEWQDVRTAAQHQKRDDTHLLLLNPVNDDGTVAYDLEKERMEREGDRRILGLQDLEMNAVHEAAHILTDRHDEDFANLITEIAASFDRSDARQSMREKLDAVRAVYGRGKTRIQSMDLVEHAPVVDADEPKGGKAKSDVRPAEMLAAMAAPDTTMAVGIVSAPENKDVEVEGLRLAAKTLSKVTDDGVVEVDCDRLQALEEGIKAEVKSRKVQSNPDSEPLAGLDGLSTDLASLGEVEPQEPPVAVLEASESAHGADESWNQPIDMASFGFALSQSQDGDPVVSDVDTSGTVAEQRKKTSDPRQPESTIVEAIKPVVNAEAVSDLSALDGLSGQLSALAEAKKENPVESAVTAVIVDDAAPDLSAFDGIEDSVTVARQVTLPTRRRDIPEAQPLPVIEEAAPVDMPDGLAAIDDDASLVGEEFGLDAFGEDEPPLRAMGM